MKPFYITTPIYYVNDKPHIGHAYASLACDVMARFKRLSGEEAFFLTGTDEHGQKIEKSAEKAGMSPQAFCDMNAALFKDLTKAMNFSNNDFIRTTEERHKKGAQHFWKVIEKHIYLDKYAGWYAVRDEAYYQEDELKKLQPGENGAPAWAKDLEKGDTERARAGQIKLFAPATGAEVEWVEEESYFFKLSEFTKPLLEFYEKNPSFVQPESRFNEVKRFVETGLKDLSISRTTFKWGIPVPGDEKHVIYVWLDALVNYITAIGYPNMDNQWPADVHVIGKDILRFHAVFWPAFLMAANLPLPKKIVATGWWTNEGQKISKSLGNVIDPLKLIEEFGLDQTRYFLMREIPFGNDGNFSRDRMITVINSELANTIGNLCQRTLGFINKNCGGILPNGSLNSETSHITNPYHKLGFGSTYPIYSEVVNKCKFDFAIEIAWGLANRANQYIDEQAPWTLKKTDPQKMEEVLYILTESIRQIGILLQPFIPQSAAKILVAVGYPEAQANKGIPFSELSTPIKPGTPLPAPTPVFPRFQETAK
jgi:methionyl-tRNA synthetase